MTRMLDDPDHRIRIEVDELLRDFPQLTADALAERFESTSRIRTFSDPELVRGVVRELRQRAYAHVRYWPVQEAAVPVQPARNSAGEAPDRRLRHRHLQLVEDQSFWWQKL